MNELQELLKLISETDQEAAGKLIKAISDKITALDSEVNKQELSKIDAIKTRDAAKVKLKAVASKIGLAEGEELEEALEALQSKKSGKESELIGVKNKEIENLKLEVEKMGSEFEAERIKLNSEVLNVALEKDIATLLPKYKAKPNATGYIIDSVKKNAVIENGKIVFKNDDNTTRRLNGNDATLDDVIGEMCKVEKDSKQSMFFDIAPEPSGSNTAAGGETYTGDFVIK